VAAGGDSEGLGNGLLQLIQFPDSKIPGFTEAQRKILECQHTEDIIEYTNGRLVCGVCLRTVKPTDASLP